MTKFQKLRKEFDMLKSKLRVNESCFNLERIIEIERKIKSPEEAQTQKDTLQVGQRVKQIDGLWPGESSYAVITKIVKNTIFHIHEGDTSESCAPAGGFEIIPAPIPIISARIDRIIEYLKLEEVRIGTVPEIPAKTVLRKRRKK